MYGLYCVVLFPNSAPCQTKTRNGQNTEQTEHGTTKHETTKRGLTKTRSYQNTVQRKKYTFSILPIRICLSKNILAEIEGARRPMLIIVDFEKLLKMRFVIYCRKHI